MLLWLRLQACLLSGGATAHCREPSARWTSRLSGNPVIRSHLWGVSAYSLWMLLVAPHWVQVICGERAEVHMWSLHGFWVPELVKSSNTCTSEEKNHGTVRIRCFFTWTKAPLLWGTISEALLKYHHSYMSTATAVSHVLYLLTSRIPKAKVTERRFE